MKERILVTYASQTGTTAGIAQFISQILEQEFQIETMPLNQVKDLASYRAIIIGSSIQDRKWLPEAIQFIQENQIVIRQRPVAIFTVCLTLSMRNAEKYRAGVMQWVEPVKNLIHPFEEAYFAGKLDLTQISHWSDRIKFKVSVWLGVWEIGDHRDWDEIKIWAERLKESLLV